jgi:hypothetical protein
VPSAALIAVLLPATTAGPTAFVILLAPPVYSPALDRFLRRRRKRRRLQPEQSRSNAGLRIDHTAGRPTSTWSFAPSLRTGAVPANSIRKRRRRTTDKSSLPTLGSHRPRIDVNTSGLDRFARFGARMIYRRLDQSFKASLQRQKGYIRNIFSQSLINGRLGDSGDNPMYSPQSQHRR